MPYNLENNGARSDDALRGSICSSALFRTDTYYDQSSVPFDQLWQYNFLFFLFFFPHCGKVYLNCTFRWDSIATLFSNGKNFDIEASDWIPFDVVQLSNAP